jgi:alpha-glucosidase
LLPASDSPWQHLYWYDRPTNSYEYVSGGNDMITEVPELEFYDYLPTVWDETRVLQAGIGQNAIIARRRGADWFIGAMNAGTTRSFNLHLDFLTAGRKYVASSYSQDAAVATRTQVRIGRSVVDSTLTWSMALGASQGQALGLTPASMSAGRKV